MDTCERNQFYLNWEWVYLVWTSRYKNTLIVQLKIAAIFTKHSMIDTVLVAIEFVVVSQKVTWYSSNVFPRLLVILDK